MDAAPRAPFCFGRFAIDLPPKARLAGRAQALVYLPLSAAAQQPGETLQSIMDAILADRQKLVPPAGRPQVVHSARMLLPDMASVIHYDDPDTPDSIFMEAVRVTGGTAFTVRGGNTVDRAGALEDAASRIGAALVPTLAPEPAEPGFCVDRGVVAMEMHWQESAESRFELSLPVGPLSDPDPNTTDLPERSACAATLGLGSHSNGDQLPPSLLRKHAVVGPKVRALGISVTSPRAGPRVLAELPGEELAMQSDTGLLLQWEHVGEPRSSERPSLSIRLEIGKGADPAAALAEWDTLLSSFRRRRAS